MDLNKVFIIGRVVKDIQLRATPTNQSVANFSVATDRVWKDKNGEKQSQVEFHNVVVWGRQAEIASQFLSKGSLVMIEGRLQTRSWQGNDGQQRRTTEIICTNLQLGPKRYDPNSNSGSFASKDVSDKPKDIKKQAKEFEDSLEDGLEEVSVDESGNELNPEDLPF